MKIDHIETISKEKKPLVSVVIPTHNRANLLQGALNSVFRQEGIGEQFDMEVIVVDDASSDATPDIVRLYPNIHYVRLETNRGASAALNVGIKKSQGKYVAILADDDLWLPHRLRVQVPILEEHPEIVVYGQGLGIDEWNDICTWPDSCPSGYVFEDFLTRTDDFFNCDTLLVARESFDKAGLFDETLPTMEHYDLALRLAFHYQWHFVKGEATYGRYSRQGKWYRNVVSGQNEQVLPVIIERALAMLPDTAQYEETRRKAHVAVCAIIAEQRWWCGGVGRVRSHLLDTLRTYPWMVGAPPVVSHLHRVARELAAASHQPITTVQAFWAEIKAVVDRGPGSTAWIRMQRLLGDLLTEAAAGLRDDGSPRRAGIVAAYTVLRDPTQLRKNKLRTSLIQAGLRMIRPL
jgi:hypothetical protein